MFGYPSAINEKKLRILAEAGLTELEMGIQSGSDRTRREDYQRNTSDEQIIESIALLHKYNIYPWIDIIYDNPYEERDDLLATVDMLVNLPKPFRLGSFGLEFLPATPLAKRAETDGFLSDNSTKNFHNRKVRNQNHVYLNSLIRLMSGECTAEYLGAIPMNTIPTLTDPQIIDFMETHELFAETLDMLIKSQSEFVFDN